MKKRTRYTLRKPKDYRMVIFLTLLCVFLILLILYTQGKMRILQDFIARQTTKEEDKIQEEVPDTPEAMPYSSDLRIVLMESGQRYIPGLHQPLRRQRSDHQPGRADQRSGGRDDL